MEEYKIYKNGREFNATEEQKNILEFVHKGSGNAVIEAAAGSAKTSTIENALRYIPQGKDVLFVAFNTTVRDEIKNDLKGIIDEKHTLITTFHGLGFLVLLSNLEHKPEVYEHKYKKYITENIDNLTLYKETKSLGIMRSRYLKNITRLVEYSRYYCVMKPKDIRGLVDVYSDIQILRDEPEVVAKVLQWGQSNLDTVDYTDLVWLPNVLNMIPKYNKYDFVFVDEAQDVTIAQEQLIHRVKKRGCRTISVGDENQRINVWCGASAKAFDNFKNAENTSVFSLSTSFRLPKVGEELIHQEFPEIEIHSAPNAEQGAINRDVSLSMVKPYTMVLCRNTTPMFKAMLDVMRMNKKCYLKGWEAEQEVFQTMIKNYNAEFLDRNLITSNGLFPCLYKELFTMMDNLQKNDGLTKEEVLSNDGVFNFLDKILCLKVLSEGLNTTQELLEKLNMIFKETSDQKDSIIFSTVHRAKGLEADHVFILYPSLLPSPFASAEWEIEAEENLKYVAFTRFKKTMNFVSEPERNNRFFLFDKNATILEMDTAREQLSLNPNNDITPMSYIDTGKERPIIEINTVEEKPSPTTRKVKGGVKFGLFLK